MRIPIEYRAYISGEYYWTVNVSHETLAEARKTISEKTGCNKDAITFEKRDSDEDIERWKRSHQKKR